MRLLKAFPPITFWCVLICAGCQNDLYQQRAAAPPAVKDVLAVRLNYRFEPDVPAPSNYSNSISKDDRKAAVQNDFDNSRPLELLDRTLVSPDQKHVLAVYHRIMDVPSEYRLDMYSPEGTAMKRLTSDMMAVHFPETIVWSPDSNSLAFVAMIRAGQGETGGGAIATPVPMASKRPSANSDSSTTGGDTDVEPEATTTSLAPTPPAPTGILTFRTEQIYICGADGSGVKAVTENEGLIYFYYAWSPDSTMLAALATTAREWKYLEIVADKKGELMVPLGRPRVIEKNGRERRLDDNLTAVHPVWSPDSLKVATAFETQIRIYDANGTTPTQAAIPLRNQLLISSQAYDRDQQRQAQGVDTNSDANSAPAPTPDQPLSMLPDEKLLVSYNPVVEMSWTAEDLLYLRTAYVKRMKNEAENVTSFARWHRLILSPQAEANSSR